MQSTAIATKTDIMQELRIETVIPPVISIGSRRRNRIKRAPIDIELFLQQHDQVLETQEHKAEFQQFRNAAHVPAVKEKRRKKGKEIITRYGDYGVSVELNVRPKKNRTTRYPQSPRSLQEMIPARLINLLKPWAEFFGHELHLNKGYIYYRTYYVKPLLFCDPAAGVMTAWNIRVRSARVYLNIINRGDQLLLRAANRLKGMQIDLIKELELFGWLINNRKFNKSIETVFA